MITISAFADEIGPSLDLQMDTCQANGVKSIDVRGIDGVNVSRFTLPQAKEYRKRLDARGFSVPCLGSPLGKIRTDEDFKAHLERTKHCCEIARILGTRLVRVFSFYPPEGGRIADHKKQVMDQLAAMVRAAQAADCLLMHENEKDIYGAKPDGVKDIFAAIGQRNIGGIFDPANYVEEGIRPYDDGWKQGLDQLTQYFHIKDKVPGADTCAPAGEGQSQIDLVFRDLKASGFSGVMTLEPHLAKAGKFQGFTGPQLFKVATDALKKMLTAAGLEYEKP